MQRRPVRKIRPAGPAISRKAQRYLATLHTAANGEAPSSDCDAELIAADPAEFNGNGVVSITAAGRAWMARKDAALRAQHLGPYMAQHLALSARDIDAAEGRRAVVVDDNESPLGWLARRKGRDGQPLLASHQLAAGERLRAEFTRAQLMPRVTSNSQAAVSQGSRAENSGHANINDTIVGARQRVRQALDAVGPEFSGLLIDVCCFLKGLEDVERERIWPARSAKIVLQLGLDRLARHYGLGDVARGKSHTGLRGWAASNAAEV